MSRRGRTARRRLRRDGVYARWRNRDRADRTTFWRRRHFNINSGGLLGSEFVFTFGLFKSLDQQTHDWFAPALVVLASASVLLRQVRGTGCPLGLVKKSWSGSSDLKPR